MKSFLLPLQHKSGRFLSLGIILIFFSLQGKAQNSESAELGRINLYLDLGGGFTTGLASLNLEARIRTTERLTCYARVGIGGGGEDGDEGTGGLGAITMLTGKGNNHFEVNGGLFIGRYSDFKDEYFFLPIFDLGYRYQRPEGGIIFRAKAGVLGIGVGIGYAF